MDIKRTILNHSDIYYSMGLIPWKVSLRVQPKYLFHNTWNCHIVTAMGSPTVCLFFIVTGVKEIQPEQDFLVFASYQQWPMLTAAFCSPTPHPIRRIRSRKGNWVPLQALQALGIFLVKKYMINYAKVSLTNGKNFSLTGSWDGAVHVWGMRASALTCWLSSISGISPTSLTVTKDKTCFILFFKKQLLYTHARSCALVCKKRKKKKRLAKSGSPQQTHSLFPDKIICSKDDFSSV